MVVQKVAMLINGTFLGVDGQTRETDKVTNGKWMIGSILCLVEEGDIDLLCIRQKRYLIRSNLYVITY